MELTDEEKQVLAQALTNYYIHFVPFTSFDKRWTIEKLCKKIGFDVESKQKEMMSLR